jgi:hypothetical protein
MARRWRWWLRIGIVVALLGALLVAVAPAAALAPMPPIIEDPPDPKPRPPTTDWLPDPTAPPEYALAPPAPDVPPGLPPWPPLDDTLARLVPELPTGPVPPLEGVAG